ncbi:MAG: CaiB/BaiF CoA-transferase family protein [Proteobacteria bacterium]|nr:CaiB/BaiF CoA-transferase family protein [Pseudomonadota bacterium]MDA0844953.1 CaiB/BaiF CoA-transferase family protein [Pseudomonadota bacterium]
MAQQDQQPMALAGVRVLDLSRILAGPYATQLFADLGADVVKVENPDGGDDTRRWGPPFTTKADGGRGDAAYFSACNRNKRSITVDFASKAGADLLRDLAAKADIIVENFRPGGLQKYGLDYASIAAINPGIIYCSITGFGQTGPYANRPGYDFLIQGMGGLMSITGQPDGSPGAGPVKVGVAVCDLFTGLFTANAALAALAYRNRTGKGQHIDCALLDSQVAMLANQSANWLNAEFCPTRMGNHHPSVVPYTVYKAADGFVIVACGNDKQFIRLTAALGVPALADDEAFITNEARIKNRDRLDTELGDAIAAFDRETVIRLLEQAGVSCGPINDIAEVFDDPQVQARGLRIDQRRSDNSPISSNAFPAKLSETPAHYHSAPPLLGEHNDEVLRQWADLSDEAIAALRSAKVI